MVELASSVSRAVQGPESRRDRLKVLVGAYACSPARGSECGVGWGWVEAISKYHDLWILTGEQFREEIEAELSRRPELRNRMRFYYIPRIRYLRAERFWPPAYLYTYKHQWQKDAYKLGKRLQSEVGFDIVHQLTYVGFRVPGLLWKLEVPFVWGPIGGLEQTTWRLIPALGMHGAIHFASRNILNEWDRRFARLPKLAFERADGGIIAATTGIRDEIRRFYGCESMVVSEVGLPPIARGAPLRRAPAEPLRLLWCGLHNPGKALPFLFSALELLPADLDWKLTIIGDGPCSPNWRRIAAAKKLNDRCEWIGQVPRPEVLKRMQRAHALVVTSVYELTSTVVVEALSSGVPVVCPDHCGFKDAVTPECGIRVPASSPQQLVRGLVDAIKMLFEEDLRYKLAVNALDRRSDYSWDAKGRAVDAIYRQKVLFRTATVGSMDKYA